MESMKKPSNMTRREFVTASAAGLALSGLASAAPTLHVGEQRSEPKPGGGPFRVIIDTDPGVDDALALLLAMRSPELKIEGITAVAGNVPLALTLPNALRMVEICGTRRHSSRSRRHGSSTPPPGNGHLRTRRKWTGRRDLS